MLNRTALVVLGLAAAAAAQDPSERFPRPLAVPIPVLDQRMEQESPAWQRFVSESGGTWVSRWNHATRTPRVVYGTGLELADWRGNSLEEARRHANQFLADQAELLGLGTSEFRESIGSRMGRTWTFTFDQYFRGLAVLGGRADVRVHMTGKISMFGSSAWPVPADFDTTPSIDELNATRIAWQDLDRVPPTNSQPGDQRNPRLVIWGEAEADKQQPFFLAWEIPVSAVDAEGRGPIGRYYVDAHKGTVLHYTNDKHECGLSWCNQPSRGFAAPTVEDPKATHGSAPVAATGTVMGWTRTGRSAIDPLQNIPLAGIEISVPGVGTVVTDANGNFTANVTVPTAVTVNLNGIRNQLIAGANAPSVNVTLDPATPATVQFLTQTATPEDAAHTSTYYWVREINEFCRAILGNSAQLATADSIRPTVNIASTCNAYYTGNTINFYATGGTCNNTAFSTVVTHEWGHGIDDRYGGISQTNGLSEAWGDTVSMYIVDYPIVGEYFTTAGGFVRTGTNTQQYPTGSGVHQQGQSFMGFAWKLRERLATTLGNRTQAIAVSNDIVISSLAANALNQADAVVQVFVADDNDANLLNGVPHYDELVYAANLHSLPYPVKQEISLTTVPLGNTTQRLTPRSVLANATIVTSGTINEVRVHYSAAGAPATFRRMIPSGVANQYQALLPGIESGTVTYHFEAVHSSNAVTRVPASGEYSYNVTVPPTGAFQGFWLENFEAATTTWTTTRQSGTATNDWQLGLPNGKFGTSSGVAWSDPAAAASSRIYGNDLGAGTSNGAYPNNMNYYLTSPVVNCSGRTGCYLRFRRWLTVEEGIYDQATIRVNGVQVWANPQNGNLVDTSWQTFEYPIPMADNNPSVQIEFRLVTDAGLALGGWNIDDVEIGTRFTPPLPAKLTMLPEMAAGNTPITMTVNTGTAAAPFLLIVADGPGPTSIPDVPLLSVGGSYFTLPEYSNASGVFTLVYPAPVITSATGLKWYSQVLTIDPAFNLVVSNQFVNLFTL
jgi:hypothetical protein